MLSLSLMIYGLLESPLYAIALAWYFLLSYFKGGVEMVALPSFSWVSKSPSHQVNVYNDFFLLRNMVYMNKNMENLNKFTLHTIKY